MGALGDVLRLPSGGPWGSPLVWLHRVNVLLSALRISWGPLGSLLEIPSRLAAQDVRSVAPCDYAGALAARLAAQGARFRAGTHENQ